jgi:hypothetical protein
MIGLIDSATVYTPQAATGAYTVLAKSGLACRLTIIQRNAGETSDERESIAGKRLLLWDGSYAMPDPAQVEINGERWNLDEGTSSELRGPRGETIYRRGVATRAL